MAPSNMTGTSSPAEGSEQVADKDIDRTLALYGSYRQTGWALSTTVIGFSTVLLAWGLSPPATSPQSFVFYAQALLAILTIGVAFAQQLFYYQGGKHLARAVFARARSSVPTSGFDVRTSVQLPRASFCSSQS